MKNETDTPETDAATLRATDIDGCGDFDAVHVQVSKRLEREQDEAIRLCQWAFPRLRAMCHDFDVTGIGWACADEMESHPEIFTPTPTPPDEN